MTFDILLFKIIGLVLVHALWQGTVVWLLIALCLRLIPQISSQARYLTCSLGMALLPLLAGLTLWYYLDQSSMASQFGVSTTTAALQNNWTFYLTLSWSIGALVSSLRFIKKLLHVQHLKRQGLSQPQAEWTRHLKELIQTLNLSPTIKFFESSLISTPMVIGWISPIILFPLGIMSGLSPIEIRAILAHELAHIKRYDHLVNLLQEIVEILFFFHPVTWWLSAKIREEREYCCDKIAVNVTGDALTLARSLAFIESHRQLTTLGLAANGGALHSRISRLLGKPINSRKSKNLIMTTYTIKSVGITSMVIILLTGINLLAKTTENKTIISESNIAISASDIPPIPDWFQKNLASSLTSSKNESLKKTPIKLDVKIFELNAENLDLLDNVGSNQTSIYSPQQTKKLMQQLHTTKGVDILSLPSITTLSGKVAKIVAGNEVQVPKGNSLTTKINAEDFIIVNTGVTQIFHPQISDDFKHIDVDLFTQIIVPTKNDTAEEQHFDCTTLSTNTSIPRGQTALLTGPIKTTTQLVEDRVPVLSRLPLVGKLFHSSELITEKKVVLITITPSTLVK